MAEIINLRTARKAKARDAHAKAGEANRLAFGRTKAEKSLSAAQKAKADKALDGAKLETKREP